MKTHTALGVLIVLGVAGGPTQSHVRGQDISDILPELKTLPAPPAIQEGTRLSYYSSVANVAESYLYDWFDSDGNWHQEPVMNPSGHGYTQADVVALSSEVAVLSVQAWQYYNFTGPLVPIRNATAALICHAGGGDWWVHPNVLNKVAETQQPDFIILRMDQDIAGVIHRVLRVQRQDAVSRNAVSYDLDTGLLVYKAGMVKAKGGVLYTQMYFKRDRQLQVPWAAEALPRWITPGRRLEYAGTYTADVLGSGSYSFPLAAVVRILVRDARWFLYEQAVTLTGTTGEPPTVETNVLAGGAGSGISMAASTLQGLRQGQLIDTDDITGATLSVSFVGTGADSRPQVTLRSAVGHVSWSEITYDVVTGVAVQLRTWDGPSLIYSTGTQLALAEIPTNPPASPRLDISFNRNTGMITIACPTANQGTVTLLTSTDGGKNWVPVPNYQDLPCQGVPVVLQVEAKEKAALYLAQVR
jgi:hypothetical protein